MIFDIVEYIIMEWTMPNESRTRRRLLYKKKKSVAGQVAAVNLTVYVGHILLNTETKNPLIQKAAAFLSQWRP